MYLYKCIFSSDDLICIKYECKVGPRRTHEDIQVRQQDRHACVHPTCKRQQISLELHKGLAQNILIELHVRMIEFPNDVTDSDQLKNDIKRLIAAAGRTLDKSNKTAREMCQLFSVGTDNAKVYPGDPKQESIRPIREVKHINPTNTVANIKNHLWNFFW